MNPTIETHVRLTLEEIFNTACDLAPARRTAYLDEVCDSNPELRRKVENMLRHHDEDEGFLETPAVPDAFKEIAQQENEQKNNQPREPMIGRQIGNYRILAMLGKGGMGEVYLAHDLELDVDVVIKLLREEFKDDPEWMARFNREGRLNAELSHPNIAGIRYKGEVDGRQFLVFEYVQGSTLENHLNKGPLPIKAALSLFSKLADALSFAHSKGIIHRDLKPANIMITPDDDLKVLDFGIAKKITTELTTIELNLPEDELTRDYGHTRKGEAIGTVVYMSPEQTRAGALDHRTDLWSFGCVMYEALTGRSPFKGVSQGDTLNLIRDPKYHPDWRVLPPKTPRAISRLLSRCFEKDFRRRPNSASQVRQVVDKSLAGINAGPFAFWPKQLKQQIAFVLTLVVLLSGSFLAGLRIWQWATDPVPKEKLLAVLPFKDGGEQAAGKIGGGLAKSLSEIFEQVPELKLMPYSAVAKTYSEGVKTAIAEMSPSLALRSLGASLILTGEVRRVDDKIEIEYRILNATQRVIQSNKLIGTSDRFVELQQNLAKEVIAALNIPPREFHARSGFQNPRAEALLNQAVSDLRGDLKAQQVEGVIALLKSLIEANGGPARVQVTLAQAYLRAYALSPKAELLDEALKALNQAAQFDEAKNDPDAMLARGMILTEMGQVKEAIAVLADARSQHPNHPDIMLDLAVAYDVYEPPAEDQTNYRLLAEQTYKQAADAWPNYWRVFNELGAFYFSRARYQDASEAWTKVTQMLPESYTGQVNLANACFKLNKLIEAENVYQQLVRQDANSVEALAGLGTMQFYRANYEQAALTFQLATEVNSNSVTPWGNLGDAYRMLAGREKNSIQSYNKAVELLQQTLRGNPDNASEHKVRLAEFLAKRGVVEGKDGNQDKARDDSTRALNIARPVAASDPKDVGVMTSLILIYHLTGNDDEAVKWVKKALEINPDISDFALNPEFEALRAGNTEFQKILNKHNNR